MPKAGRYKIRRRRYIALQEKHKAGVSGGVFNFNLRTGFDLAGEARCFLTKAIRIHNCTLNKEDAPRFRVRTRTSVMLEMEGKFLDEANTCCHVRNAILVILVR